MVTSVKNVRTGYTRTSAPPTTARTWTEPYAHGSLDSGRRTNDMGMGWNTSNAPVEREHCATVIICTQVEYSKQSEIETRKTHKKT